MSPARLALFGLIGSLVMPLLAHASETENPYQSIATRNAFGLKPKPAMVIPEAPKPPSDEALDSVTLTAIIVINHAKTAYFDLKPARPANAPVEHIGVKEGRAFADLQVREILEHSNQVRVLKTGQELVVGFERKPRP